MPALTRLSLSLCVAPPPPPGMTVRCCAIGGGLEGFRGPLLTALDLWQVSFPDKGDDGRALKVRAAVEMPHALTEHLRPRHQSLRQSPAWTTIFLTAFDLDHPSPMFPTQSS